ncbi:HNH endonuclease family protein [Vibrio cyclitrophicus]|uniref:hypothetical protein n=1 Tax=Vibrio cyclitrophicus TaxID=47951 RepID=UPI0011B6EED7|nr:hypothetical protein [Vibrio cyclitrophicus]
MRNIDQYSLNIPAGWITKAQSAEIDVANGLKTIEQCSYVWRELKNNLSKISNKCCWYCESEIARNDNAVDHFRPKGTVKGLHYALSFDDENEGFFENYELAIAHSGYKWSAFKKENFRYSCDFCNEYRKDLDGTRGGKTSYFPLLNEDERAQCLHDEDQEVPALLDPCSLTDWELLSYDIEGKPFSRFERGTPDDLRVRYSIYVYHLDYDGINEARAAKWIKLSPLIDEAKRKFNKLLRGDAGASAEFDRQLRIIRNQLNPQVNCSYFGFLIYMIKQDIDFSGHPWLNSLVNLV